MRKILFVLMSLLLVVGCSKEVDVDGETVVIKHDLGESEVVVNPEKVVIFDLGILDMYSKLDLNVFGLPKSNLSNNLSMYNDDKYKNVGTLFEPDFEALAKYAPDLIIISGRAASNYDELKKLAPTISLNMDNSDFSGSLLNRLDTLKALYPNKEDQIEVEKENILSKIEEVSTLAKSVDKKTMFILTNGDSISLYGPGSRFGMVFDDFNFLTFDTIEYNESTHGQQISFEFILDNNPDIILVMDRVVVVNSDDTLASDLLDNEIVNLTKAALNDEIYYVDPFVWYLEMGGISSFNVMVEELLSVFK